MGLNSNWVKEEIKSLQNENIKKFVIDSLKIVPKDFFAKPASSTGKFHPFFSNVESGLLNGHIHFMWVIAKNLCELWGVSNYQKEQVFAAVILHDSFKYCGANGKSVTFTARDHAKTAYDALKRVKMIGDDDTAKENILKCVRFHMHQWSSPKSEITEAVESGFQNILVRIVQEADYLSSRKEIVDLVLNKRLQLETKE